MKSPINIQIGQEMLVHMDEIDVSHAATVHGREHQDRSLRRKRSPKKVQLRTASPKHAEDASIDAEEHQQQERQDRYRERVHQFELNQSNVIDRF